MLDRQAPRTEAIALEPLALLIVDAEMTLSSSLLETP